MTRFLLLLLLSSGFRAAAQVYYVYVSPNGSDQMGTGLPGAPYQTIPYGIAHLPTGGTPTLVLLPGTMPYVLTAPVDIRRSMVLQGQGHVVIDGRRLTATGQYLLGIRQTSNVTVEGITFRNCINDGAKGIWITDGASNVTVQRCTIENVGWRSNDLTTLPSATNLGISASAIKIDGNSSTALATIRILDDSVRNCAVGYGEGITITGNVDGFAVLRNVVQDIANIGIDAAGNHFTGAPASVGYARNGLIAYNEVSRCMSGRAMSAGIYLDGARKCTVVGNRCTQNGVGISVGNEAVVPPGGRVGGQYALWSNEVTGNVFVGLSLGADTMPQPVRQLEVLNNTVWGNQTGDTINGITQLVASNGTVTALPMAADVAGGEIFLQRLDSVLFENNIVVPRNRKPALYGSGYAVEHFRADYNCYYSAAGAFLFQLSNPAFNAITSPISYGSVSSFSSRTGLDIVSVFLAGDPGLTNPAASDFTLSATSPLLDRGDPGTRPATGNFALDCASRPRLVGNRLDLGAYENQTVLASRTLTRAGAVALYPNPAAPARLTLANAATVRQLVIRTALGAVVRTIARPNATLDLSALPPGLYLVEITPQIGAAFTQRLVLQ